MFIMLRSIAIKCMNANNFVLQSADLRSPSLARLHPRQTGEYKS